jgi:hypothetical protein
MRQSLLAAVRLKPVSGEGCQFGVAVQMALAGLRARGMIAVPSHGRAASQPIPAADYWQLPVRDAAVSTAAR